MNIFTKIENERIEEISEKIQEQQKSCKYVTELTKEKIVDLIQNWNYFFLEQNGIIKISWYKLPLIDWINEENQIYRFWWLTILWDKKSSINTRKLALKTFIHIKKYIEEHNLQLIMKTENIVIWEYLNKIWAIKLTYDECIEKYPNFIKAYTNKSGKSIEYYKTQTFYIIKK